MMGFDYWNHPLVVKALRVKYRGATLNTMASIYVLLLLLGLVTMYVNRAELCGLLWICNYLFLMISI